MAFNDLELELQKVGLDSREAKVYLAALEIGPSPVQKIAQRAGIPRATVYLVLDDLQNKGFVTTYDEGKKTFFVAESPERLITLAEEREIDAKQRKETVTKLVPELIARGQFGKKSRKTTVKFYEGPTAMKAQLRDDLAQAGGEVLNIFVRDKTENILNKIGVNNVGEMRKRAKMKRRIIYTNSNNQPHAQYPADEAVFVPNSELPIKADIAVIGDRVALVPYDSPMRGIAIEDAAIADSFRSLFNLLWSKFK